MKNPGENMDLNKNKISENVKSIHLIAICGTGMGALGSMLKDLGYKFLEGNDAPRGGAQGYYIKVSKIALDTLISNMDV